MRWSIALLFLLSAGCGSSTQVDVEAARAFILNLYESPEIIFVEGPEYADIPKIPKRGPGDKRPDRAAGCGVRVKFVIRDGSRISTYDQVIFVSSDHKALDFGAESGDDWRQYVQSLAKP